MSDTYEVGKMPHIIIETCHGDLVVKGWSNTAVLVKGDATVKEADEGLVIHSNGRLRLSVPENSRFTVTHVHGDAVIRSVQGDVNIAQAAGDVILTAVANIQLGDVQGDLSVKNVSGLLTVHNVSGDAIFRQVGSIHLNDVFGDLSARGVTGDVTANTVMGDLSLRSVTGDVTIHSGMRDANFRLLGGQTAVGKIQGDIRIHGSLAVGKHAFTAHGDIIARWPAQTPLTLTAVAPQISNRLPLDEVSESEGMLIGSIGEDGPVVTLTANGRIVLKDLATVSEEWDSFHEDDSDFDFAVDLEGLGAQISAQVNQQMLRLTAELESKFGTNFAQTMAEKIARKAEKAAERAEKAAERTRQRAEWRGGERRQPPPAPRRPGPPPPPAKKASTEEQLKILKMVEQGIISPEEANMLLEALEK